MESLLHIDTKKQKLCLIQKFQLSFSVYLAKHH